METRQVLPHYNMLLSCWNGGGPVRWRLGGFSRKSGTTGIDVEGEEERGSFIFTNREDNRPYKLREIGS